MGKRRSLPRLKLRPARDTEERDQLGFWRRQDSVVVWQSSLLAEARVPHGFSTRHGGVSQGPFATLNLSLATGDDPTLVLENRRRFCQALALDSSHWTHGQQVHGRHVAVVTEAEVSRGASPSCPPLPATDGLWTQHRAPVLAVLCADCLPVLLYDPSVPAVGVVHAGWRGILGGILEEALGVLGKQLGGDPSQTIAVIGPSIGPCCYEVGFELADQFAHRFEPSVVLDSCAPRQGPRLDLWRSARLALQAVGLSPQRIEVAGLCTACHPDQFYSHRAQRSPGRLAGIIRLPPRP